MKLYGGARFQRTNPKRQRGSRLRFGLVCLEITHHLAAAFSVASRDNEHSAINFLFSSCHAFGVVYSKFRPAV